jgi:orotidine-5'-phosphate decarboxylase
MPRAILPSSSHPRLAPRKRVLVALDVARLDAALDLLREVRLLVGGFKVGLELCTAEGAPRVAEAVAAAGGSLFLDLKLHDIPNTVAGAVRAVCAFGPAVRMLTLHCQGGAAMLRAAVEAARAAPQRPLLIGVTVLTSVDQRALGDELGVGAPLAEHVVRLALLARDCGLDGVVASPHEVAAIRAACGDRLLIITPGVRPEWAASGDQRRVMTPAAALRAGADYLVIGRPITAPPPEVGGPAAAAARILHDIEAEAP